MRHLVVCGATKEGKPLPASTLVPRPRRQGPDHTVLLQVAGKGAAKSVPPAKSAIVAAEAAQSHNAGLNFQGHNVLLTVAGNPAAPSYEVQNPDLILSQDASNSPDMVVDDGKPVTVNRMNWLAYSKILLKMASTGDYWHKFIVHRGAGYSKLEIMHALFDTIHPEVIAPVMYRREGSSTTFLVRTCLALSLALVKLSSTQMQIQVVITGSMGVSVQMLDVEVIFRHTTTKDFRFHVEVHLAACIARRHDKTLKVLDLSAFHQDPELSEMVFWALWVRKSFLCIYDMLKPEINAVRCLNLAGNELVDLPRMDIFFRLEVVDLSSNKISKIGVLRAFTGLNITDITLDRNPLCASFLDEHVYVQAIKEILPTVKKIDGVYLIRPDLPVWRRHYVPPGQTECVALVDQFLQHYFTLLDGDDRQRLHGMYHPDAMFSLTCNYVPGQSTSSTARLTRYTLESRNLLRLSDYSKSQQLLSEGAEEVLSTLCRLPSTEHDPYSFTVDVPYFTEDTAVIVVTGVFREPSMMNENLIRGFSRTFALRKVASKEYQIVNEMLTVSNASTKQAKESFKYPKPKVSLAKLSFNPAQDLTDADRKQMTRILSRLTEMNQRWAQKCLEESKWDIKLALVVFTDLLKTNELPGEAFDLEDQVGGKQ